MARTTVWLSGLILARSRRRSGTSNITTSRISWSHWMPITLSCSGIATTSLSIAIAATIKALFCIVSSTHLADRKRKVLQVWLGSSLSKTNLSSDMTLVSLLSSTLPVTVWLVLRTSSVATSIKSLLTPHALFYALATKMAPLTSSTIPATKSSRHCLQLTLTLSAAWASPQLVSNLSLAHTTVDSRFGTCANSSKKISRIWKNKVNLCMLLRRLTRRNMMRACKASQFIPPSHLSPLEAQIRSSKSLNYSPEEQNKALFTEKSLICYLRLNQFQISIKT